MHAERWPNMTRGQGNWSEERIELLRSLLEQRLSARVVAMRLGGGVTRNAVIGKAKRMGFALQSPTNPPLPRYKPLVIHEDVYVAPEDRKGVLELTSADCKWPIGDPREADFHFCGGPRVPGLPYCEGHCKRAYQTVQEVDARRARRQHARRAA